MTRALKNCLLTAVISFLLFLSGCGEEDCISIYHDYMNVRLISEVTKNDTTIRFNNLYFIRTGGQSMELTPAHNPGENGIMLGRFGLPLDPHSDTSTFVFRRGVVYDTLAVTYSRRTRVLSSNCGLEHRYLSLQIEPVKTTFDSVKVIEKEVIKTPKNPNVQIKILP